MPLKQRMFSECIYSSHFLLKLGSRVLAWLRDLMYVTQGDDSELRLEGRQALPSVTASLFPHACLGLSL